VGFHGDAKRLEEIPGEFRCRLENVQKGVFREHKGISGYPTQKNDRLHTFLCFFSMGPLGDNHFVFSPYDKVFKTQK